MSESHRRARILEESAGSAARILKDRKSVAESLADTPTSRALKRTARPNSLSKTLRKAGVALIIAPDPITAVPGVAMLGASLAARRREPLGPSSVTDEARSLLDELDWFA